MVNFGLSDLLGLQLSPRIRDPGKITLYRAESRAQVEALFPHTGPLLTRKLNTDLIAEHYDDLLRLAGSLKFGRATASLLVGKLSASGRQNALAAALKEYGALRRSAVVAWTTEYYGLAVESMRSAGRRIDELIPNILGASSR